MHGALNINLFIITCTELWIITSTSTPLLGLGLLFPSSVTGTVGGKTQPSSHSTITFETPLHFLRLPTFLSFYIEKHACPSCSIPL